MNKWIAVFDLEDGDTMPDHMDLQYAGARIDFYCKPVDELIKKIENVTPKATVRYGKTSVDSALMVPLDKVVEVIKEYCD